MKKNDIYLEFENFCAAHAIKHTSQRFAIFDVVYQNKNHPTVDEIFKQTRKRLPMIKLESVYRILADFQKCGLICKVGVGDLIRYDSNTNLHAHFVCQKCGKIVDISMPKSHLPTEISDAKNVTIIYSGICGKCREKFDK